MSKEIKCPWCKCKEYHSDETLESNGTYDNADLVRCNECLSAYWTKSNDRTQKALLLSIGKIIFLISIKTD